MTDPKLIQIVQDCRLALFGLMEIDDVAFADQIIVLRGKIPFISDDKINKVKEKILTLGYLPFTESGRGDDLTLRIWGPARQKAITKDRVWLHILLFALTVLTTTFAGAQMEGLNPYKNLADLVRGIPFSFTLLSILVCHEFGHYFAAQKHGINVTLPFFIPVPPMIPLGVYSFPTLGTFGAFIRVRAPFQNREQLMDVGAAGPIAGFIVAVIAVFYGLATSPIKPVLAGEGLTLGDSLMMKLASWIIHGTLPPNQDVYLNGVAFAGWLGLLITAINMIPIGQLDGGHVIYAMFGKYHRTIAIISFLIMAGLSFYSSNWIIWLLLIFFVVRLQHPPTLNDLQPLDRSRWIVGWISIIIFILCFTPVPIHS